MFRCCAFGLNILNSRSQYERIISATNRKYGQKKLKVNIYGAFFYKNGNVLLIFVKNGKALSEIYVFIVLVLG